MRTISYADVIKGNEIEIFCRDGRIEDMQITNIPSIVHIGGIGSYYTIGEEPDEITYKVSVEESTNTVNVEFSMNTADSLIKCMMLKDTLLLLPLDNEKFLLRLRVRCACKDADYDKFMLVLDLGNTRTCALTCSTMWDPADQHQWETHPMTFEPLKMRLNYKETTDNESCNAIFSSKCVLGTNIHFDWTRSFLQLDSNADMFLRNMPSLNERKGHISNWRWTLSGPKRYFWQQDILRYGDGTKRLNGATSQFHYLVPEEAEDGTYEFRMLDLGLAKVMGYGHNLAGNPEARRIAEQNGFYPYSIFLKGMLWELMEQAELQVNKNEDSRYPFRLTDLVVTFPAVWTEEERSEYERQIRQTVNLYVQQRCGACAEKITVDVTCDEGMAVLVSYLYSEIQRKCQVDEKIAVIDIGGGTSDLVVGQIDKRTNDLYGSKYLITPIYSNGTNEAGDAFIRNLVVKFVVPTVFNWMFNDLQKKDYQKLIEKLADVINSNDPGQFINRESLEKLVFDFWYPVALELLEAAKGTPQISGSDDFQVSLDGSMGESLAELWRILKDRSGELRDMLERMHNPESLRMCEEGSHISMSLYNTEMEPISQKDFLQSMKLAIKQTFAETLQSFSRTIYDFNCKTVLFSGKISEVKLVQDVFREYMTEVDPSRKIDLISMNSYNYKNLPFQKAVSQDSKYATVTGAALYHMIQSGRLMGCDIEILPQKKEDPFIWGVFREGEYKRISRFLNATLDKFKRPVYVARKCSEDAPWLPSYELRTNPLKQVEIAESDPVKFRFGAGDPHPVLVGEGKFSLNGKWFDTRDKDDPDKKDEFMKAYEEAFQFRIYKHHNATESGKLSWLDSGMVFDFDN